MDGGIALYSSSDLYAWKYESVVLRVFNCSDNNTDIAAPSTVGNYPAPSCTNGNGLDLERPKVVQCGGAKSGGKFVMWVRGTGYGNTPQLAGIATADSPKGLVIHFYPAPRFTIPPASTCLRCGRGTVTRNGVR